MYLTKFIHLNYLWNQLKWYWEFYNSLRSKSYTKTELQAPFNNINNIK